MSLAILFARIFGEWRALGKTHNIPAPRTDDGYALQDHLRQADYDLAAQLAPRPVDYVPERIWTERTRPYEPDEMPRHGWRKVDPNG